MKAIFRNTIIIILALIVIITVVFFFKGPVLYSLKMDLFSSKFHNNVDVLKIQSINSTTDVLPMIQELADYSGPIVVNINLNNTEQVRHDLELFSRSQVKLNNLVVNLNMAESELNEFSRSKARQKELLSTLLNSSISLNELESLEIQNREKDNPDILTSVKIQKDVIRKKVQALAEEYRADTNTTTRIGSKFGIDTTAEKQSVEGFTGYARKTNDNVENTVSDVNLPVRRSSQILFLLYPESARYGDTITCLGTVFLLSGLRAHQAPDIPVTIYIDNLPVTMTRTDSMGSFSATLPIGRITPGSHGLYVRSETTESVIRTLNISSVDSKTTLSAGKVNSKGNVTMTGTVTANHPVTAAPVQIILDEHPVVETMTNAKGEFKALLTLPVGNHTVAARFAGNGFPINPSESEAVAVTFPLFQTFIPSDLRPFLLAGLVIIFLLFAAGAVYYLRHPLGLKRYLDVFSRSTQEQETPQSELDIIGAPDVQELIEESEEAGSTAHDEETHQSHNLRLTISDEPGEAAHKVYREFSRRVAHDMQIRRHTALTPREIAHACTLKPYCGVFFTFVMIYEKIRYGGDNSPAIKDEFETSVQKTTESLAGEDH